MKQSKTLSIILATTLTVMLSATAHAQADSKSAEAMVVATESKAIFMESINCD